MRLLEREHLLDRLAGELGRARDHGRLVLLVGEAGIGKTALVEAFCRDRAAGGTLRGACDSVVPARPFAPIADMAAHTGGPLQAALEAGERNRIFDAFLALLRGQPAGVVVVFEDLHWADEATLDLIRVVGRRLHELRLLVVGTLREEEVGSDHALTLAVGDLPAGSVTELRVPPLSAVAVETLAAGSGIDPDALHRATAGNPFFLTEVLSGGERGRAPVTVRDAVLARAARLSSEARAVVEAASLLGTPCERDVLLEVAAQDAEALDECVARGILEGDHRSGVRFRHELALTAVADGLPRERRAGLHARALGAFRDRQSGEVDRLAGHAAGAGDADAVLELAPAAGDRAARLGAHRTALQHYAAALRFADGLDERSRASLLERHAHQAQLADDGESALASQRRALAGWRRLGDARGEGDCLRGLSHMLWQTGDGAAAVEAAEAAVEVLESAAQAGPELARALAGLAQCYAVTGGDSRAEEQARRALTLAERLGEESVAVHALTTIGIVEVYAEREAGWGRLEEALRRARAAELGWEHGRILVNLVEAGRDLRRYGVADRHREEALAHVGERGAQRVFLQRRLVSDLAELDLERGRWGDAERLARSVLDAPSAAAIVRARSLTVLGRLRARQGEGDPWEPLDEAVELGVSDNVPLAAARAEAAWLAGDLPRARHEAETALADAAQLELEDVWWRGELAFWARKAASSLQLPAETPEPLRFHVAGRYREAAARWGDLGCPYYQALALADSPDEHDLRSALAVFHALGARPMSLVVARRLRAHGARRIPRGPRPTTARNPAGLTRRELEVLVLVGAGLRNVDIAERLVVSRKTVDKHVSAVLRKLRVRSRAGAVEEAARLGLQDGDPAPPR